MFAKLRQRIIFYCTLCFAIFFAITFSVIFVATHQRSVAYANIILNEELDKISLNNLRDPKPSNCMIYFIDEDKKQIVSYLNFDYYDTEIIKEIAEKIFANASVNGRVEVDGYKFVYATGTEFGLTKVAVIDFTQSFKSIRILAIALILAFLICVLAVFLVSIPLTSLVVMPIEGAFDKQNLLIANASHELKTPLTIINTNLSALESDTNLNLNEGSVWVKNINEQSRRMSFLVNEMLELAKMDKKKKVQLYKTNISQIISGIALTMEAVIFEKGITLVQNIDDYNYEIMAEKQMLEKVGLILFDNAIKYSSPGGVIEVGLTEIKGEVLFYIKNTGKGIAKENLEKVFHRFYREDESRNQINTGFGLGLSIAKEICKTLGGKIWVESQVDSYAKFVVKFKRVKTKNCKKMK